MIPDLKPFDLKLIIPGQIKVLVAGLIARDFTELVQEPTYDLVLHPGKLQYQKKQNNTGGHPACNIRYPSQQGFFGNLRIHFPALNVTILAIESSCDETAAAVIRNGKIINNIIASQAVHIKYGGVVPELASRAHEQKIVPVVEDALRRAGVGMKDLDAVAYTRGPGLVGSLLVGASYAKGVALSLGIPLIEVNHMQAHVMAHFLSDSPPEFPFLCLTVSGGHTQLVLMRDQLKFELIGQTRDDAAGEAFDKGARMLGLPYPGGPQVDRLALTGDPLRFRFPNTKLPGYDFSFSGIKTSLLYLIRDEIAKDPDFVKNNLIDLCAGYQFQILNMLMEKLKAAAGDFGVTSIGLAGGVAANAGLRRLITQEGNRNGWKTFIPDFQYCTDNAAMIAITAHFQYLAKEYGKLSSVPVASLASGLSLD